MSDEVQLERIKRNWEMFVNLCHRLSDDALNRLIESFGDRAIMCPASPRLDQYGAEPGGMVSHVLQVTSIMRTLNDALEMNLPVASILKVGLLHDLGKVGDLEFNYFIDQDSDWHREKLGQVYKYNENITKVSVSHRSLFLLQHFGVKLSNDEWLAIQLAQGSHFEENRFYVGHEPSLALLLQQAKQQVIHQVRNSK